jgi:hypothetical protein
MWSWSSPGLVDIYGLTASSRSRALSIKPGELQTSGRFDTVLAVHTSVVEPLPHQITAVYKCMLPRQTLRFLMADEPLLRAVAKSASGAAPWWRCSNH